MAVAGSSTASAATTYRGYPDSIAVLGHSGSTGEDSDPKQPHVEIRENSWATGTNPEVRSVYGRILAKNPRIKGHNIALSQGGATVQQVLLQAQQAMNMNPKPELILVQVIDNDIVCPAESSDYASFRSGVVAVLKELARAPASRVFLVSQFGSPATYARSLTREQRQTLSGSGPCDFVDSTGNIVKAKAARLDNVIHHYEAQLASACKHFANCRYDGGAFGRVVDKPEYITEDLNHFSVRGHAKAAAVAWAALKRAGLVPR
ncbi:MAG TPA: hypothetical protein VFA56_12390 [Gaiellaceae bacterium]|nr:hypothetical protein [Gaiellaceae bacterium]